MAMLDEAQARALLERVLKLSTADITSVSAGGSSAGNIRYARNTVSTAGEESTRAERHANFGKRSDHRAPRVHARCARGLRPAAEELRAGPDIRNISRPGRNRTAQPRWFDRTAAITPDDRARIAAAASDRQRLPSALPRASRRRRAVGRQLNSLAASAITAAQRTFVTMRTDDEQVRVRGGECQRLWRTRP